MVTINSLLAHQNTLDAILLNVDGNVRAAMLCWAFVLSAFVVLRISREVLLGCLLAATASVGLAVTAIELTPERAIASLAKPAPVAMSDRAAIGVRGPAAIPSVRPSARERPY